MSTDSAHENYWQTSEVIFGIPLLLAILLQFVLPVSLPGGLFRPVFILLGVALMVVGVAFIFLARREFSQQGQPTDPGRATSKIVSTGVFSLSRNPIYLGVACFVAGVGLTFNLPWALLLLAPSLVACHYVLIKPEERYLDAKFGQEYRAYSATVHRWLGRRTLPGGR